MNEKKLKKKVFISYSHKDEKWKDRLVTHLKAFVHQGDIVLWDDRKIDTGEDWFPEIEAAMKDADVAVCLISAHYLASDFINKEEIPALKRRRQQEGMLLMPILISPCPWEAITWLKGIQMFPKDGISLAEIQPEVEQEKKLSEFALEIHKQITSEKVEQPVASVVSPKPDKVDIDRLPETGAELFGRQKELQLLDEMWDSGSANVISFVAWGGVGKSTLVNQWLDYMKTENYRGAKLVFGWSFYSQGTSERVTSADKFISESLTWFGDPGSKKGSPWDKGQRLADLVRKEKTLLILDGLEPLQSGHDFEKGKIKDPALSILVTQLARNNNGLCVITTREKVPELGRFEKSTLQPNLDQISKEAGRALLRVGGVQGTDKQLEAASEAFGNHALAINLLASYIHEIEGHHIKNASEIPDLDIPEEEGKHPRRVIEAFEKQFGEGPQVQLLRILGLFDRPVEMDAIKTVYDGPSIRGLTGKLRRLKEGQWNGLFEELRTLKLLAKKSSHRPDIVDCHPLVREHFGQELQRNKPKAWKEAHCRLYEYYKGLPEKLYNKFLPDTLKEMEPLFSAVSHGCLAGRQQETFDDVYWMRIQRGLKFYSTTKVGAFGTDLAVVSNFFEELWSRPASDLMDDVKALVLNLAGFRLYALGRLSDAIEPMTQAVRARIKLKQWGEGANDTVNLAEVYLVLGDVERAVDYGRESVIYADQGEYWGYKVSARSILSCVLHQSGNLAAAEELFEEEEEIQRKENMVYPYSYSIRGYRFCELLLSQRQYREVEKRAWHTLELAEKYLGQGLSLWDIALDKLSLGRAYLLEAIEGPSSLLKAGLSKAEDFLNHTVDGLRETGQQLYLPFGLFARAELYRYQRSWKKAWADLEETKEIAERGQMNLYLADYHLEAARLCLAECKREDEAREHYEKAAKRIESMGYHRRDPEVLLIQAELEIVEGKKVAAKKTLKAAERRVGEMGCHRWDIEAERLKNSI